MAKIIEALTKFFEMLVGLFGQTGAWALLLLMLIAAAAWCAWTEYKRRADAKRKNEEREQLLEGYRRALDEQKARILELGREVEAVRLKELIDGGATLEEAKAIRRTPPDLRAPQPGQAIPALKPHFEHGR